MKTFNDKEYQRNWMRNWRKKNPEKVWQSNHSELAKLRQARYRVKHRKEISERNVIYQKYKRQTDILAKLRWLLRSRINGAIKKCKGNKAFKSMELIGCTLDELRTHLEKQFTSEMNWKNHGKVWEIDHIKQVKDFDLTNPEEQKKCFHYTNLRPLNWLKNRKEQNRIVV